MLGAAIPDAATRLAQPDGVQLGEHFGRDSAFYVSNNGASAGIGEVLRIEP